MSENVDLLEFCLTFYHTAFCVYFQGMCCNFKKKYRIFRTKKGMGLMPFLFMVLHLSVDKKCQYDTDDSGDGKADSQAKLQC